MNPKIGSKVRLINTGCECPTCVAVLGKIGIVEEVLGGGIILRVGKRLVWYTAGDNIKAIRKYSNEEEI